MEQIGVTGLQGVDLIDRGSHQVLVAGLLEEAAGGGQLPPGFGQVFQQLSLTKLQRGGDLLFAKGERKYTHGKYLRKQDGNIFFPFPANIHRGNGGPFDRAAFFDYDMN